MCYNSYLYKYMIVIYVVTGIVIYFYIGKYIVFMESYILQ